MPSRQNARRWRRLEWEEIREGIQDTPAPIEEPDFEPAPEPIQVTAEAVPLPTEFSVVVEAEALAEPETRVQFITNPDQKKKHDDLVKKHQATEGELEKVSGEVDAYRIQTSETLEQNQVLVNMLKDYKDGLTKKEWDAFQKDILYIQKIETEMFRKLALCQCHIGEIEIHIHCDETTEPGVWKRPKVTICKAGAFEGSRAITMLLGTWIALHPSTKYYLIDTRNLRWWQLIGPLAKDVVLNMIWEGEDIRALYDHAMDMDGNEDADGGQISWESFFIAKSSIKEGNTPLLEQAMGVAKYFDRKGLDIHKVPYAEKVKLFKAYQEGGKWEDIDFGDREEMIVNTPEQDRWEAAKNSVINL